MSGIIIKKRTTVRIVAFALAVIAVLSVFFYKYNMKINKLQRTVSNTLSSNFEELRSNVNNINIALEKSVYCGTAVQLSSMAAELWCESGSAKTALSQLPYGENELTTINKFLSQVGDYSLYLSKKTINGAAIQIEERDNLTKLSQIGQKIEIYLDDIGVAYNGDAGWTNEINAELNSQESGKGFGKSLEELEDTLTDYPSLIYDGPFSENRENEVAKAIEGDAEISREAARSKAAYALSVSVESITDDKDEDGNLPSFGFKANDTVISISKKGGEIVYFRKYNGTQTSKCNAEETINTAQEFLSKIGNSSFVDTYYYTDEGVCTINFAYKDGDYICYPDLIKVGVSLNNKEVVLYDARGYIMNHTERNIPTPAKTVDEARSKLSPALKVKSVSCAVIPSNKTEKNCYEFLCSGNRNEDILVYINCENLIEEKILILLKSDGGTLTK